MRYCGLTMNLNFLPLSEVWYFDILTCYIEMNLEKEKSFTKIILAVSIVICILFPLLIIINGIDLTELLPLRPFINPPSEISRTIPAMIKFAFYVVMFLILRKPIYPRALLLVWIVIGLYNIPFIGANAYYFITWTKPSPLHGQASFTND
jgi:hypothetical protein